MLMIGNVTQSLGKLLKSIKLRTPTTREIRRDTKIRIDIVTFDKDEETKIILFGYYTMKTKYQKLILKVKQ
jgi:hypothetical protein